MYGLKLPTSYLGKWERLSQKKKRNKVQENKSTNVAFPFPKDCEYTVRAQMLNE